MRPDNETKIIIIVNDQREVQVLHSRLIELSDELRLSRKVIKSVYGHYEVCFDNTIRIFILLKDYKYIDGLYCEYFAISTFDIGYIKNWQNQLSPHGKELTSFNEIRDKIKELVSKEKNEMRMDEMNRLFEERGFTVTRNWCRDGYHFIIGKGGHQYSSVYVYPSGLNVREASQHQREFVDDMIKRFEDRFKIHLPDKFTLNAYQPENGPLQVLNSKFLIGNIYKERREKSMYSIKNVIFNNPATIVFWTDGTKTVVKTQGDDIFDPEKGLAMAISKKAMGNKGNYCNELKKWLPKEEPLEPCTMSELEDGLRKLGELASKTPFFNMKGKNLIPCTSEAKYNPVQKAYDILVGWRDGKVPVSKEISKNMPKIDELIGYLGEALDD